MSKKDEPEKPKESCLSALGIFVRNFILGMLGFALGNFLVTQCREPQWSDYLDHIERQEDSRYR